VQDSLLIGQVRVLEMLAQGKPLETVLTACLEFCESHSPEMLCSILLLDAEGRHLRHGAAPSLPEGYMKAIDGSPIGPTAGSCGTAAFKGEAVIVEDIATDPLWAVYKDIALPYGLRSCWSTPIFDAGHKVLGTFAMYYRRPGRPEAHHQVLIGMITHVAGIAIACRRAEEEKRNVFERISDAFVALDAQWRYTYVNARAGRLLGRDPAGLLGKHIWTEFPEAAGGKFQQCCEKAMRDQEPCAFEEHHPPHGKWYENRIYPSRNGATIYFHDVTDRRRTEENLRQSEKMNAIGQLAGGIAHDFNNQLSVMLGYAGLLENRIQDPELKRFASAIVRAANRSGDLTRNLLSFSRQGHVENVPIDVHELIDEMIDLLGHSFDRRIAIQRRFNAGYAYVLGDPSCLQNALLNLALNARDAMPNGGTLDFATDSIDLPEAAPKGEKAPRHHEELSDLAPGAYLRIRVSDTGTGMTEDVLKRIFEPFFTTKPIGKGTGMGMASVFGAMRSHKGRILVESAPEQGATFHLYLPLTGMGQAKAAPHSPPAQEHSSKGMRVLIVDDEIPVRSLIADMLKDGGHTVIGAAGGREGLRIFKERWREVDLVLLDMVMADIDGFDTFQELRRIHPGVKVIVSSGYTADGKIEALIGQGAKGLLQKPYGKGQLEKALAGAME
jgi:PAS domain S-box-containing protein